MSAADFQPLGLSSGTWSGTLSAATPPRRVMLVHLGAVAGLARVSPAGEGAWRVEVDLPPAVLSDGTHTLILMADEAEGEGPPARDARQLASLAVIAGEPLDDDLRAEIDLLRAELDLIKREFRRLGGAG